MAKAPQAKVTTKAKNKKVAAPQKAAHKKPVTTKMVAKPVVKAGTRAVAKPKVAVKPKAKPKGVVKGKVLVPPKGKAAKTQPAAKSAVKKSTKAAVKSVKKAPAVAPAGQAKAFHAKKQSKLLNNIVKTAKKAIQKIAPKAAKGGKNISTQPVEKVAKKLPMTQPTKPTVKPVIPANISPQYHPRDNEEYMNPTMLAFFRNQLMKWRAELEMESQDSVRDLQETTTFQPDMNDQASVEYDQSMDLRARDRERKLIQKIDEALERIEDGSYGYCVETGEPIGVKRLLARPVATLSIEAKTMQEREEKNYAG